MTRVLYCQFCGKDTKHHHWSYRGWLCCECGARYATEEELGERRKQAKVVTADDIWG